MNTGGSMSKSTAQTAQPRSIAAAIIGAPICTNAMVNRAFDAPTRYRWYPANDYAAFEFSDGSRAQFRFSRATLGWDLVNWAEPADTHMWRSRAQAVPA
jgi:hypothetical protein